MKKGLSKYKIVIDSISKTLFFKIMIVLSFILVLYGFSLGMNLTNDFIIYSLVLPFVVDIFNLIFFLLLLLNAFNIYYVIKKNYNYLIRLGSRNNYVKHMVSVNLIFNGIWCFIIFILLLSCNIIFRGQNLNFFTIFEEYNISSLVYGCFYIFRYYFFALLISTIFILFLIKFKEIKSFVFMLFILFSFLFMSSNMIDLKQFNILPWRYFMLASYSSFVTEVCYSLLYCVFLEFIFLILYKLSIDNKKIRFREIYFLLNDFEFFIKKNKIIILICCLLPLLLCFVSNSDYVDGNYIFQTSLGLNIEKNNLDVLSLLLYCINMFSCIYIFISSFVKNYSNLTNIYLRYNFKMYYFIKSISNIIMICLLKLVQYGIVGVIVKFIINKPVSGIINLFIKDLSLTLFLGFLTLLFYVVYKIFNKSKFIIGITIVILFYCFIINPLNICKINYILFVVGITILIILTNYIIIKNNKKVIQEIGGV